MAAFGIERIFGFDENFFQFFLNTWQVLEYFLDVFQLFGDNHQGACLVISHSCQDPMEEYWICLAWV